MPNRLGALPRPYASPSAVLIDEAAQEAWGAANEAGASDQTINDLSQAESEACDAIASVRCANDMGFIETLRYLRGREIWLWGAPNADNEFGSIAVAVDRYFDNRSASDR